MGDKNMAMIWNDGFDHYQNGSQMAAAGYGHVNVAGFQSGRTGNCVACNNFGFNFQKIFDVALGYVVIGIAFYADNTNDSCGVEINSDFNMGLYVNIGTDGSLKLYDRHGGNFLGKLPANSFAFSTWNFIELKGFGDASLTHAVVRLNGDNSKSIIVNNYGRGFNVNSVRIGNFNGGTTRGIYFDDLYILDETGDSENDLIGDRRQITVAVTGDSGPNEWTPTGAATNYDCINEQYPNDGDYITATAQGQITEFSVGDLSLLAQDVSCVRLITRTSKSDAGDSTVRLGVNSNGNVLNSPPKSVTVGYGYNSHIFPRNPDGNVRWDKASVENLKIRLTRET